MEKLNSQGLIFNIQRFSVQDGPGIRTTVFSKGCPLSCMWCSNPESQKRIPQIAHIDALCTNCGNCVNACEKGAISLLKKGVKIKRELCDNCGKCVDVCCPEALKMLGERVSVEEVIQEVSRDKLYYKNSFGGVTLSGGEPLSQPDFAVALLKRCREVGFHTCLDTSGYGSVEDLDRVLEQSDLLLFDLKHMDPSSHVRFTGVSNELILDNLRRVVAKKVPVIVRVPLIPSVNDSVDDVRAIASFVASLNHITKLDILPYHRFGVGKYKMLDMNYKLAALPSLDPETEKVEEIKWIVRSFGLDCECG